MTERLRTRFSADFTNVLNWVEFDDPSLDLTDPAGFAVLNTQLNRPRFIQLGLLGGSEQIKPGKDLKDIQRN